MNLDQLIACGAVDNSLVLGYYGGGNFGDELLLEVLQNRCALAGIRKLTIGYRNPANFQRYHHDLGYAVIDTRRKWALLRVILHNKALVIGGGGLWGLDFNTNVLLLSGLLFISRWLLGKQVYLLGVGYYKSTTRLGHIGAWLAAKAANTIAARDDESYANFSRYNRHHTAQSPDIAWSVSQLNCEAYAAEAAALDTALSVHGRTVFVALRHFRPGHHRVFTELIGQLIADNPEQHFIVTVLEPEQADPEHYQIVRRWQQQYPNVQGWLEPCNPLILYRFLRKHRRQLLVIAPQFHLLLAAHLAAAPFLPIVYDNKVSQLLTSLGCSRQLPIARLQLTTLQRFVDCTAGGAD